MYNVYIFLESTCYIYKNESNVSCYSFNWFNGEKFKIYGLDWRDCYATKWGSSAEKYLKSFNSIEEVRNWIKTEIFVLSL